MYRILESKNLALLSTIIIAAALLIATASTIMPQRAYAAAITWDGGGDGYSFSDPLNWDMDTVPVPGPDDIIIIPDGDRVILDIDLMLEGDAHITINGGTLDIDVGKTLTVANTVNGGTAINNIGGTINNVGTLVIANVDVDNADTEQTYGIGNFGTINNYAIVTVKNGNKFIGITTGIYNEGTINNFKTMTVANNDLGVGIDNVSGLVNNFGNFAIIDFQNSGNYGIINDSSLSNTGEMNMQNTGYSAIFNTGTIENSGFMNIHNTNGVVNFGGSLDNNGEINIQSSVSHTPIEGFSSIDNSNGGIITNHLRINIQNTGDTGIWNDYPSTIDNFGTIVVANSAGPDTYGIQNHSIINNAFGATIINSGTIINVCSGIINNEGTFTGTPVNSICDTDHDGIADVIDTLPAAFSNDFSDTGLGGSTSGTVVSRGRDPIIHDVQNSGIKVRTTKNSPESPTGPLIVSACGGSAVYNLSQGSQEIVVTCGSATAEVVLGPIDADFFAVDGTTLVASAIIETGNTIAYDPVTKSFTAGPDNISTINVILANGNTVTVDAGETVQLWTLNGFYSPVDMNSVVNTIKGGQSVPLKYEVFAGTEEKTGTGDIASFTQKKISCSEFTGDPTDAVEELNTLGTGLKYDTASGQFIANWKTPKSPNTCWEVKVTTADGSSLAAFFRLI